MHLRLLLTTLSAFGVLPIMPAQASGGDFIPFWYAGISVAKNKNINIEGYEGSHNGLNAVVDGLHLGYQFNPYVMTEIEFQYLGDVINTIGGDDYKQGGFNIKFGYPLTNELMPYMKVGGAGWFAGNGDDFGVSSVFGGGVLYQATDNISFNLEYQYTDSVGNADVGHQRLSLGLSWRFGRDKVCATERVVEVERFIEVKGKTQLKTVIITNSQGALFANNSSVVNNVDALLSVEETLIGNPGINVIVSGYTDSVGSSSYNQWLSERRAQNVAIYLMSRGIQANRISFVGYGELAPAATNETAEGRALNRRVVIGFE